MIWRLQGWEHREVSENWRDFETSKFLWHSMVYSCIHNWGKKNQRSSFWKMCSTTDSIFCLMKSLMTGLCSHPKCPNLYIMPKIYNPSWFMFMKHLTTFACQKKITVGTVCVNLEIRMLNDHHIQALSLTGVFLLTSKFGFFCYFLRFFTNQHQRWLREW